MLGFFNRNTSLHLILQMLLGCAERIDLQNGRKRRALAGDAQLLAEIPQLVRELPSYGTRQTRRLPPDIATHTIRESQAEGPGSPCVSGYSTACDPRQTTSQVAVQLRPYQRLLEDSIGRVLKVLTLISAGFMFLSPAIGDDCQTVCTNEDIDCVNTCTPEKGPMGVIKCVDRCNTNVKNCIKTKCKTPSPKPKDALQHATDITSLFSYTPRPIDWEYLAPSPPPKPLCDCRNPSRGGCEQHFCVDVKPWTQLSSPDQVFNLQKALTPNFCGFCANNPGLGACLASKCRIDLPIAGSRTPTLQELIKAQNELGSIGSLNRILRDAGALSKPDYHEIMKAIGDDSGGIKTEYLQLKKSGHFSK